MLGTFRTAYRSVTRSSLISNKLKRYLFKNDGIEYFERSLVYIPSCSGKKVEMKKLKDAWTERKE